MKNPFLEDRNIFSKVQKPSAVIKTSTNQSEALQGENKPDERKSYTNMQFNEKLGQKTTSLGQSSAGFSSGYQQRQAPKFSSSTQYNLPSTNSKFSTQKITFGDPSSSQAYQGQRTSGYFNIQSHITNSQQTEYNKYEPKVNNFTGGTEKNLFTKNSFAMDSDIKQQRFDRPFGNQKVESRIEYEFAPPPINNFSNNDYQPIDSKYGYKEGGRMNYQFKSGNQLQKQQKQQSYSINNPYDDKFSSQNIYSGQKSQQFKSPPKQNQPLFTPKNDISYQFKQNNYGNFSPIGEVSQHKIVDDTLMNLDGLMENMEIDKLLAESKTQQELLKILGMDASAIKKNQYHQQQTIKNTTSQNPRSYQYQYEQKTTQQTTYMNPRENQFSKKIYQQQSQAQKVVYQNQTYNKEQQPIYKKQIYIKDNQEPQVLNYGQNNFADSQVQSRSRSYNNNAKAKQIETYNISNSRQLLPKQIHMNNQYYKLNQSKPLNNAYFYNDQEKQEEDLETIINKEMEKFIFQRQGPLKDKRIFMTASQKIVTKKYNLAPL